MYIYADQSEDNGMAFLNHMDQAAPMQIVKPRSNSTPDLQPPDPSTRVQAHLTRTDAEKLVHRKT